MPNCQIKRTNIRSPPRAIFKRKYNNFMKCFPFQSKPVLKCVYWRDVSFLWNTRLTDLAIVTFVGLHNSSRRPGTSDDFLVLQKHSITGTHILMRLLTFLAGCSHLRYTYQQRTPRTGQRDCAPAINVTNTSCVSWCITNCHIESRTRLKVQTFHTPTKCEAHGGSKSRSVPIDDKYWFMSLA